MNDVTANGSTGDGWATTEATTTSADGTAIAYDRRGTGPAVILVGGAFQHRAVDQRTEQIADQLVISDNPVNFHIKNLMSKLQANDRAHAVTIALKRGLLHL